MLFAVLLTLFYLLLFNFIIYRFGIFQIKQLKPAATIILFNLKFLTGIFIWAVYTFYYKDIENNDVHKFYNDAIVLNNSFSSNPHAFMCLMTGRGEDTSTAAITTQLHNWNRNFDEAPFNENRTIIRLNALLMFISFRSYFVHILCMCFISLMGWGLLINAVFKNSKAAQASLAFAIMLLPSVLFWTSGVMKEPVLVLGLGLFITGLLGTLSSRSAGFATVGFGIILISKFFILAALLPAALAHVMFKGIERPGFVTAKYAVVFALLLSLAFSIHQFAPRIDPAQMLVNKQVHSVKEAIYYHAGSRIDIPAVQANALSILLAAPVGVWNTIARPYLWEGKNMMMVASALENLLVLLIILCCLFQTDYKNLRHLNLVLMLLSFSLAYFALIGICTPVLGSLVRYRAPVLPFFLFALLLNIKPEAFPKKISRILQPLSALQY